MFPGRDRPVTVLAPDPVARQHATSASESFDELCIKAISHLRAMKTAKPAKTSTLHSTIKAKLGKEIPASTVDMVCSELVKRGHVKVSGKAVSYALPAH